MLPLVCRNLPPQVALGKPEGLFLGPIGRDFFQTVSLYCAVLLHCPVCPVSSITGCGICLAVIMLPQVPDRSGWDAAAAAALPSAARARRWARRCAESLSHRLNPTSKESIVILGTSSINSSNFLVPSHRHGVRGSSQALTRLFGCCPLVLFNVGIFGGLFLNASQASLSVQTRFCQWDVWTSFWNDCCSTPHAEHFTGYYGNLVALSVYRELLCKHSVVRDGGYLS